MAAAVSSRAACIGDKVCYPHLPCYVKGIYISEDTVKEMLLNAGSQTFLVNIMFSWWVAWAMNVLFQHKNKLHQGQGLGWRFSSVRLRMANGTVTSRSRCLCSMMIQNGKG